MPSNKECWNEYTSGLSSPQSYLEWSWRYLISAALQRRVWCGPEHQKCFPNMYVILVGQPGIGKGLVIKEVSYYLKFWRLKDAVRLNTDGSQEFQSTIDTVMQADLENAAKAVLQSKNGKMDIADPKLIPVAADATTYEALVSAVANGYRRINFLYDDEKEGKKKMGIYGHSSQCFSLQELSSLIRNNKNSHDTVKYMLGLYDCPDEFEYDTKTKGMDRVKRGCLNLLAGTTPGFMQSVFDESFVDEGFTSRTFFIYSPKNRKNQFWIPPLNNSQNEAKQQILNHVRKLTGIYGHVKTDTETAKFLEEWWNHYCNEVLPVKMQKFPKLIHFYPRYNIHIMKIAMADYFGEFAPNPHCETTYIPLEYYTNAIKVLENEERSMQMALTMEGDNPLSKIARRTMEVLQVGKRSEVDLLMSLYPYGGKTQQQEALEFLLETKQIIVESLPDPDLPDRSITYYKLTNERNGK